MTAPQADTTSGKRGPRHLPGFTALPFATLGLGLVRFLLVAGSHGGKSTLIAHALSPNAVPEGADPQMIDDNETWFDPWGRAVCLHRPLVLRAKTQEMLQGRMPAFREIRPYRDDPSAVAGQPIARASFLSRHPIDAIVFLSPRAGAFAMRALTKDDCGRWASYILRDRLGDVPRARDVRLLARVVKQAQMGAFELAYEHPEEGVLGLVQLWRQAERTKA